jgi:signal transduction histidine kinase
MSQHDAWIESLVLVGTEVLRRCEAIARLRSVEQTNLVLDRQAALGRYIVEMRHNLNNALTAVMGNAELLMSDGQALTSQSQVQLETIRNMALRMHEILQRFSSLEKEMTVSVRQGDTDLKSRSAAAAW